MPVGILSAFVPTLIPQQWLALELEDTDLEDTVGEEELMTLQARSADHIFVIRFCHGRREQIQKWADEAETGYGSRR